MQDTDEINIYDLWLLITKRKKLFWLVFIMVFAIGLVVTLTRTKNYQYTQAIQVAHYYDAKQNRVTSFIASAAIISKIQTIYMPTVLSEYNAQHPNQTTPLSSASVKVTSMSANGGLISLSVKGSKKNATIYSDIFNGVLQKLQQDTALQVQKQKIYLTNYLTSLTNQVATQSEIEENLKKNVSEQNLAQQLKVVEQLAFLSGQQGTFINLIQEISITKYSLAVLQDSHFVADMVVSRYAGISKTVMLLLTIIMGFICGFFCVLLIEFLKNIKKNRVNNNG